MAVAFPLILNWLKDGPTRLPPPLILNWLKDGPPPFRSILRFPPPFPSFNKFRMSGKKFAALQPSFPRKRESRTVLPYNAASPASHHGIPACAGMTVKGRDDGFMRRRIPAYAGRTVGAAGKYGG